jgi:hypothetical protein
LDTNSLQVEWLGTKDTDAKQEVKGSSAGGREKSRDLLPCGYPVEPLPVLKYFFPIFLVHFWLSTSLPVSHRCRFIRAGGDASPNHCRYTTLGLNPTVKGFLN